MIYVKNENELTKLPNPQQGDIAVIDNGKVKVYDGTNWVFMEDPNGELTMNLYELNKNSINLMDTITDLKPEKEKIQRFLEKTDENYYMLLSNECHYYTLFSIEPLASYEFSEEVLGCLQDIGDIKLIDNDYGDRIECWVSNNSGCHLFMLFPYARGVISCH